MSKKSINMKGMWLVHPCLAILSHLLQIWWILLSGFFLHLRKKPRKLCWSIIMPQTDCRWQACQVNLKIYMQPYIKGMTGTLEEATGVRQSPCWAAVESETLSKMYFISCWPWMHGQPKKIYMINISHSPFSLLFYLVAQCIQYFQCSRAISENIWHCIQTPNITGQCTLL